MEHLLNATVMASQVMMCSRISKLEEFPVSTFIRRDAKNTCTQRLADLSHNATNGSYNFAGRTQYFGGQINLVNCTSDLAEEGFAASSYLNYGQYGRPAFPGSMLRMTALVC